MADAPEKVRRVMSKLSPHSHLDGLPASRLGQLRPNSLNRAKRKHLSPRNLTSRLAFYRVTKRNRDWALSASPATHVRWMCVNSAAESDQTAPLSVQVSFKVHAQL